MIAKELLDVLNKAQNETSLDPVAVWALSKYLQGTWKDGLDKKIRPFDLGKALSEFFVDLSQHRLPAKITKQTPETEPILLKFFGATDDGLPRFWKQCIEIWSVALEPHPAYATEVQKYFDMLLRSSLKEKRPDLSAASIPASAQPPVEVASPIPLKTLLEPEEPQVPISAQPSVESSTPLPLKPLLIPEEQQVPTSAQPSVESSSPVPLKPLLVPEEQQVPVSNDHEEDTDTPAAPALPELPKDEPKPLVFPKSAFLVLQGTRVIPLNQPVITIGRRLDNHIILEDPRVSRSHAQIKLINDRFVIFDTNSTGGTYINGRRTGQSVLYPGDVISLAGVIFIYSQELPAKPGEVKIIELGSPFAADRPTAVLRREEIEPNGKTAKKDLPELPKTGPLP